MTINCKRGDKIMDRKISWITGCHDEIELVYEKAEQNDNLGSLLSELEQIALNESVASCGFLAINNKPITPEMVMGMSEQDKELIMFHLSEVGLRGFNASMTEPKITVTFGPNIKQVLGCTMFSLLNRLEKIDGAYNVRFPKATLELQIPLGGRSGMFKWTMLIMQLYPWLSVSEVPSNTVVEGLSNNCSSQQGVKPSQTAPNSVKSESKKSFLSKLFGKK